MNKSISVAAVCAVLASPALAATKNMENPLYIPRAGDVYSKTGAGLMYKEADSSLAMRAKNLDGETEFPILRISQELGVGITDRLSIRGRFGWTQDDDINRKGMHEGRIGLNYRVIDQTEMNSGIAWDVYADAFLGGVSAMKADLISSPNSMGGAYPMSFNYGNYANGRWGAWLGTQVGKTWDAFTLAGFAEIERTFGNNNNEIKISSSAKTLVSQMVALQTGMPALGALYASGLPGDFNVDTKGTWEYNAGLRGFWDCGANWSFGGAFTYKHHSDNTIEGVNIKIDPAVVSTIDGLAGAGTTAAITNGVASQFNGSLQDGWDEYILTAVAAYKLTDTVQLAVYGEYTMDDANAKSQNGTDVKAEVGVRLNLQF
ncbi:hypothetical protein FACS189421_08490 [Bacteroidia bacterium]|nr:hypothetical protein FACS189421_08490 [Bacteroidia bacterium]